jgi:hypothetical protein
MTTNTHTICKQLIGIERASNFKDLLRLGQAQLQAFKDGKTDLNVTGIEDRLSGVYLDQMIILNKYVYTIYSTNFYDSALSIEFVLPLSLAKSLTALLKPRYWYTIVEKNILHDIYIHKVRHATGAVLSYVKVEDAHAKRHMARTFEDFLNHKGWYEYDGCYWLYNSCYFHYSEDEIREDMKKDPVVIEPISLGYCDPILISGPDPLVTMTVEDPDVNRKDLYAVLIEYLQSL